MKHQVRTEITIDAPIGTVWQHLTELENYEHWNPFIVSANGAISVGSRLIARFQPPGGRAATFRPTVTVVEPERVFEWLGRLGLPGVFDGRHRFELSPTAEGGTKLVHGESFRGLLVRPLRRTLDSQTVAGFNAMNQALKARSENRTTADTPVRCR